MTNYASNEIVDLNTSFERSLSKLSEHHNIFEKSDQRYSSYGIIRTHTHNTLACICSAISAVICFSPAAGIRISHSAVSKFSVVSCAPGNHLMEPPLFNL